MTDESVSFVHMWRNFYAIDRRIWKRSRMATAWGCLKLTRWVRK